MRRLMGMLVVAAMIMGSPLLVPSPALAMGFSFSVDHAMMAVSDVGQIDVHVQIDQEGKDIKFNVDDRSFSGMSVMTMLNGMDFTADHVSVTYSLDGENGMGEHEGTVCVVSGADAFTLEFKGDATVSHMMGGMHAVTIYSKGDFKVKDAMGAFADFKGMEGMYHTTIVEHGVMVGSPVTFSFSAM